MFPAALLALVAVLNIGESHLPHEVARRWGRVFAKSGYKVVFSGFQVEAGIQQPLMPKHEGSQALICLEARLAVCGSPFFDSFQYAFWGVFLSL